MHSCASSSSYSSLRHRGNNIGGSTCKHMDIGKVFILLTLAAVTLAQDGEVYERLEKSLGCFNTKAPHGSSFVDNLLLNLRTKPGFIKWKEWWDQPNGFYQVINACADEAQKKGYVWFAVEFWGECRTVDDLENLYNQYGEADNCKKDVGGKFTMMVYKGKCDSVFGCCPGDVIAAKGPNNEGCLEPTTLPPTTPRPTKPTDPFVCTDNKLDIAVLVDSSGSIDATTEYPLVRVFLASFSRAFIVKADGSQSQFGGIRFSTSAQRIFAFDSFTNNDDLFDKLNSFPYVLGWTHTDFALDLARTQLFTSLAGQRTTDDEVVPVAVVLTDGESKFNDRALYSQTKAAAQRLKYHGVHVFSVGVGDGINQRELEDISTDPTKDVFLIADFKELISRVYEVARAVCKARKVKTKREYALDIDTDF